MIYEYTFKINALAETGENIDYHTSVLSYSQDDAKMHVEKEFTNVKSVQLLSFKPKDKAIITSIRSC